MAPLLFVVVALAGQLPNAATCKEVRAVKSLAVKDGYTKVEALDHLERKYCGLPPAAPREDCMDLWILTELAWTNGATQSAKEAEQMRAVACATGRLSDFPRWRNGVSVRTSNGALLYANGVTAKSAGGVWRYPNGVTARSADGYWMYPNGVRARSIKGQWTDPMGRPHSGVTEMLLAVCGETSCAVELEGIRDWDGEARIIGTLRIAWEAANRPRPAR